MKVMGIIVLLSGLIFILYSVFIEPESTATSASWAPWIGILVFITGAVSIYVARDEDYH